MYLLHAAMAAPLSEAEPADPQPQSPREEHTQLYYAISDFTAEESDQVSSDHR